jgi:hypothetical protein
LKKIGKEFLEKRILKNHNDFIKSSQYLLL